MAQQLPSSAAAATKTPIPRILRTVDREEPGESFSRRFDLSDGLGSGVVVFSTVSDGDSARFVAGSLAHCLHTATDIIPADAATVAFVLAPHPQTAQWTAQAEFAAFVTGQVQSQLSARTQRRFELIPVSDFSTISSVTPVANRNGPSEPYALEGFRFEFREDGEDDGEGGEGEGGEGQCGEDGSGEG